MEIADYLRVARRSLLVLLVVPLAAALLAGVVTVKSPPMYQATATVDLPLGDGKSPYSGSHGQVLYLDDFRNAVTSDPVITDVAKKTGVPGKKLSSNLQVRQVGSSSVMTISYTANNKSVPAAVVEATATATLDRILQTQFDAANSAKEAAIAARQPSLEHQAHLTKLTGGVAPDHAIRSLHREIASLKRQQHNLQARGVSPSTLVAVEQQLNQTQAQIVAYAPIAVEYQAVKTELNAANQVVNKQSQAVEAITVLQQAAKTPSAVIVTPAKRKPRLPTLISSTVAAAAAGAFLALGIIAVMELLARRRRQRSEPLAANEAVASVGTDPPSAHPSHASGMTTEVEPARSRGSKRRHRREARAAAKMRLPLTQK